MTQTEVDAEVKFLKECCKYTEDYHVEAYERGNEYLIQPWNKAPYTTYMGCPAYWNIHRPLFLQMMIETINEINTLSLYIEQGRFNHIRIHFRDEHLEPLYFGTGDRAKEEVIKSVLLLLQEDKYDQ